MLANAVVVAPGWEIVPGFYYFSFLNLRGKWVDVTVSRDTLELAKSWYERGYLTYEEKEDIAKLMFEGAPKWCLGAQLLLGIIASFGGWPYIPPGSLIQLAFFYRWWAYGWECLGDVFDHLAAQETMDDDELERL